MAVLESKESGSNPRECLILQNFKAKDGREKTTTLATSFQGLTWLRNFPFWYYDIKVGFVNKSIPSKNEDLTKREYISYNEFV